MVEILNSFTMNDKVPSFSLEELAHKPHILIPEYCWKPFNTISLLMVASRALLQVPFYTLPFCFTQHAGAAEESNDL